jgi:hypothetical protein
VTRLREPYRQNAILGSCLNRPFLGEKKKTMEIREKTAFSAIRYFLAGTVMMRLW